jgi:hypothetical protein
MVMVVPTTDTVWFVSGSITVCGTTNGTLTPELEWILEPQTTGPSTRGQVTVQSTPKFAGSPDTVAPKLTIAPAGSVPGRGVVMTVLVTVDVMVTVVAELLLRSVVDNAVTATVFFVGTPGGAV